MCQCTPNIRTPWCGKPGCKAPIQQGMPVMKSFSVGDKVVLKSGGPEMTVFDVVGDGLHCNWMSGTVLSSHVFVAATVKAA